MIRNSKEYEEIILKYLNNPGKYDHFSFNDSLYNSNLDVVFKTLFNEKNPSTPTECAAYLFGKACEVAILTKARPEFKRIWVSADEVTTNIILNLPTHLEDIVLEMLDGCENAVEEYLKNEGVDVKDVLLNVQYIAEKICNDDRIADEEFENHSNKDVAFPSEAYVFANNAVLKQLADDGYKILGVTDNPNSPVSSVLVNPEGVKMVVLECVTVAPKTAKFQGYLKDAVKRVAEKDDAKPFMLGIMLEAEEEDLKNKGIILKSGKTIVRRTDFIPIE